MNNTKELTNFVRSIIREYLQPETQGLKRHMNDDTADYGHAAEIMFDSEFADGAEENEIEYDHNVEYASDLPEKVAFQFGKDMGENHRDAIHNKTGNFRSGRTRDHFDYRGFFKDQGLIHFTDDAVSIALHGFTKGVQDFDDLGLTTDYPNDSGSKKYGGYNFAYDMDDFERYGKRLYHGGKYGSEAVVFRASGIETGHYGDQEPQMIFGGKSAHDIVPIEKGSEGYFIRFGEGERTSENLEDLAGGVVNNYDQYRKPIRKQWGRKK